MLRAIFNLPWPLLALISAGLFWLAQDSYHKSVAFEAEKAEALAGEAPVPVPLDEFTEADVGLAREVHVTAWINLDYSYELTKQRKGTDTVRRMYVLFGPGDAVDSKVARGVVVLDPSAVDNFVELLAINLVDPSDPRFLFTLNGERDPSPDLSDMVDDALKEKGLVKAAEFLAIEPYLKGRAEALAPHEGAPAQIAMVFGGLGVAFGLFALVKGLSGRRRKKGAVTPWVPEPVRPPVVPPMAAAAVPVAEDAGRYATLATPQNAAWSPLEAVKAKQAMQAASGTGSGEREPKERLAGLGSSLRRGFGFYRKMAMAAVAYGVLFMAFGMQNSPFSLDALMPGAGFGVAQMEDFPVPPSEGPSEVPMGVPSEVPSGVPSDVAVDLPGEATPLAMDAPLAAQGAVEPAPKPVAPMPTPVEVAPDMVDAAALQMAWLDNLRGQILWALVGAGGLVLVAGAMVMLRRGPKQAAGADPWDRLSDRLR